MMSISKALLVVGAESAGNRYLVELLASGGAVGVGHTSQPFDGEGWHFKAPGEPKPACIALARSYPHGGQWPDLPFLLHEIEQAGFEPTVLVIVRGQPWMYASQVRNGHVAHECIAESFSQYGYQQIFRGVLMARCSFFVVAYDWLAHPGYRVWLANQFNLAPLTEPFVDGDKYYRARHAQEQKTAS
jgi:hypothetical protein